MKALSSFVLAGLLISSFAQAAIPGNKRTIFTSGEKVYPIRYQLGQSTVIDFGVKPEDVICGNVNYFNIEKLKNRITIQPLSNFSTNLTVLSGEKRFLFYLIPANGPNPDGFIDVRWVHPNEQMEVKTSTRKTDEIVELNQQIKLSSKLMVKLDRVRISADGGRRIYDLQAEYKGQESLSLSEINLNVLVGKSPSKRQTLVWEKDLISKEETASGRLIVGRLNPKDVTLVFRFKGKTIQIKPRGARN